MIIVPHDRAKSAERRSALVGRIAMGIAICMISAATVIAGVDPSAPSVEDLVIRNEETLSRVNSIAMTMRHTVRYYRNNKEDRSPLVTSWIWARAGERERLRFGDPLQRDGEGHPTDLQEVYIEGAKIHRLSNWDPDHPFAITPAKTRVSGMVDVYTGEALIPEVLRMLGWSLNLPSGGEMRRTLLELAHASPRAELLGSSTVDGHRCWELKFAHPGLPTDPLDGTYFRVFLDPAVGYLPRRVVEYWRFLPVDGTATETRIQETVITIKSFDHPESDVWVPTEIETHIGFPPTNDFRETIVTTVGEILVNEPLIEEKLAFAYPENCIVSLPSTDPDHAKRVLWGKNNQPGKEIRRYEDIPGADDLAGSAGAPAPIDQPAAARGIPWLIIINTAVLALICIVVAARRLRK